MCGGPAWKREIVPDHKFDFVDTREFTDTSVGMRMKYLWLYAVVLKSFLVYISDIFTATTMLTTKSWSNQIFNNCPKTDGCVFIPFNVGKWLFVGCIIFSFLLLAYEARKSKKIIASRDISYAFTNIMANKYYSLRSYHHFCFFDHIAQSTRRMDDFAFFVFFTFKTWKRVLLADGPRQTINALTLYAIYLSKRGKDWWDVKNYFAGNNFITTALTITTLFTVLVFIGSLLLLVIAGFCYIPLLCIIQGNLKEYCCHKVDKRIAEVIKRRNKQRLAKAAALAKKEAAGDFSHLKNKKGELIHKPLPQPTLPNISLDEDELDDAASIRSRGFAPSTTAHSTEAYYGDYKTSIEYPPMPAYHQPYSHQQDPRGYAHYSPSSTTLQDEQAYDDDNSSTVHLSSHAAPYAHGGPGYNPYSPGYVADPYDVYSGTAGQYGSQHQHPPQRQLSTGSAGADTWDSYASTAPDPSQRTASPLRVPQAPYTQRPPSPGDVEGHGYRGGGYDYKGSGGNAYAM